MDFYRPPTTQGTLDALGTLYRAVRAWRFYPKGHPTRRSKMNEAHSSLLRLLNGNTLSLACGRTGFSFPDGEFLKETKGLSNSLAFELFIRRVQKITFFHDLYPEDLLELCKLLCLTPEVLQQTGGIDALLATRGVRTIWVNEFDLTAIRSKRNKVEQSGVLPQGLDETESSDDSSFGINIEQQAPLPDALTPGQQLQTLLERLTSCDDDDSYLILARQAVTCADDLLLRHESRLIFPLIELLANHASDETHSYIRREYAEFAIEQIITTGEVLHIVLELIERGNGISKKALSVVLRAGGTPAISAAIEQMGLTNSIKTRKILSTMLSSLGEAAVPALLDLMYDTRWFIIRNICAILGAIASIEALPALTKCLHYPDLRVRKEAIRSLAQLGGQEAEATILNVLRSPDTELYPQAVASLGGMKSKASLAELLKLVISRDLFLQSLPLKIDALAAIASIGDRQVTPYFVPLLEERHLLAAVRGRQLKAAVAVCLGKLGDIRAVPTLKKLAFRGGVLGSACAEAILMIEKTEGRPDGIS